MKKQGTNKIGKIISYIVIALVLVAVCGLLAYLANGFSSDYKVFYVECDGQQVLDASEGFEMSKDKPMTVDVKYTFGAGKNETHGYSVKVIPNTIQDKDFDFTLDGNAYSFQAEDDLTAGFEIEHETTSFTITPKGGINEIMKAVYPTYEVGDCVGKVYENMFTLLITSYNGKASIKLNFTVVEKVEGIILDKEVIEF